jgi:hypothetical protein
MGARAVTAAIRNMATFAGLSGEEASHFSAYSEDWWGDCHDGGGVHDGADSGDRGVEVGHCHAVSEGTAAGRPGPEQPDGLRPALSGCNKPIVIISVLAALLNLRWFLVAASLT